MNAAQNPAPKTLSEEPTGYLVNTIRFHSEFPSETLGGVGLRAVLGQLALILVAYGRLRHGNTTHASALSRQWSIYITETFTDTI